WLHARDAGALFDHAGTKALHLGIVAPRLAFGKEHAAAATRQHSENAKDDGAYKIPTHSPRHASRMRWFLLTFLQRLPRGHRSTPVRVTLWLSTDVERVAAAGLLAVQAFGARALSQLRSHRRHVRCLMPPTSAAALTQPRVIPRDRQGAGLR